SLAEFLKLRADFIAQLSGESAVEEVSEPGSGGIVGEFAARVHQAGNLGGRQRGMTADEGEVQADAQARILSSQGDGLGASGLIDHQACGSQDAFAMGAD